MTKTSLQSYSAAEPYTEIGRCKVAYYGSDMMHVLMPENVYKKLGKPNWMVRIVCQASPDLISIMLGVPKQPMDWSITAGGVYRVSRLEHAATNPYRCTMLNVAEKFFGPEIDYFGTTEGVVYLVTPDSDDPTLDANLHKRFVIGLRRDELSPVRTRRTASSGTSADSLAIERALAILRNNTVPPTEANASLLKEHINSLVEPLNLKLEVVNNRLEISKVVLKKL